MNQKVFKRIIYVIGSTMALLLVTQVYRSIQNYEESKQKFIKDVQIALDLGIESHYADKAKNDVLFYIDKNVDSVIHSNSFGESLQYSNVISDSSFNIQTSIKIDTSSKKHSINYSYSWTSNDSAAIQANSGIKTNFKTQNFIKFTKTDTLHHVQSEDSILKYKQKNQEVNRFAKQIVISMIEDTPNIVELTRKVAAELKRKNLDIGFEIQYNTKNSSLEEIKSKYPLFTTSKSTYLPDNSKLDIYFENASRVIIQKGMVDFVISFLILFIVMSVLIYLYRIIVNQKQLALIKDDLINNITHEFKTPIATIGSAIEGISNFNDKNDKEKTRRYLNISTDQLKKLNNMVEKILQTATIDSDKMDLKLEDTDLVALTKKVVDNFQILAGNKVIRTEIKNNQFRYFIDTFHMENALSNLVDNAIKYGGDEIQVIFDIQNGSPKWQIIDNGGKIEKEHRELIFDKLYRIPHGNRHDVKGFGIGLYYTKAIIERHKGEIKLVVKPQYTCFTVSL